MNLSILGTFFKILVFVIVSWVLIHTLAIFGIFLALAFPIWWLFLPTTVPCLGCGTKKPGQTCPFCKKPVESVKENHPKNFASTLFNSGAILLLSVLSLGLVLLENKIIFKVEFPPLRKSVSFSIPPKGQYKIGELIPTKIEISGMEVPINAVQTDISFDTKKLEFVDISTKDSFATVFIQKEIDNEKGYARLSGGIPNPGYSKPLGLFATFYFRGKESGLATIDFLPSSLVLANNGHGTNLLKSLATISYIILPQAITPQEQEKQNISLKTAVLGEKTEETKMTFYEDQRVLGTEVNSAADQTATPPKGVAKILYYIYEQTVRNILSFWNTIFEGLGISKKSY